MAARMTLALFLCSLVTACYGTGGDPNPSGQVVPMYHVSEGGAITTSVDGGAFELWCDTAGYCWWVPIGTAYEEPHR